MFGKCKQYLNILSIFVFSILINACVSAQNAKYPIPAAENFNVYLGKLKNKKVGLVVNQTSMVGNKHLVDTLISSGISVNKIFAPEHGFRGTADAGEHVKNGIDEKSKVSIVSLYGKNYKPFPEQLKGLDIVVFDIQDVGARFYTFISTLHYVMEACAENNIPVIVLDRPNPNGQYFDGPVLDTAFKSFVGMHPIPIVHGLTMAELANMINGEGWLKNKVKCNLEVVLCANYTHESTYSLPIKPSPNLPNDLAITLYPSLCLFEGVRQASVGRGTTTPFQIYGGVNPAFGKYTFVPKAIEGMDKKPKFKDSTCYGHNLIEENAIKKEFTLKYVLDMYQNSPDTAKFFNPFFDKLAGNNTLRKAIKAGKSESEIRKMWKDDLKKYAVLRKKYLLY